MIAPNPGLSLSATAPGNNRPHDTRLSPKGWLSALNWRYAVKQYDPARRIDEATWQALQESLVLAPSSIGLQPSRFFVVEDKEVRARLREASWGQTPVTDADRFVVFAARTGFSETDIDRYIARVAEVRNLTVESLAGLKQMAMSILARPEAERDEWTARQTYIALGTLVSAAAALGVDATPMEGFDPAQYDAILGLREKGYRAVAAVALGFRSPDDKYGYLPKVRFPREELVRRV